MLETDSGERRQVLYAWKVHFEISLKPLECMLYWKTSQNSKSLHTFVEKEVTTSRVCESERISPGARSPAGAWKGCLTAITFISASREWKLLPNQKRLGNACDKSLVIYFFSSLRNPQYSYYSFLANPSVLPLSTHGLNTSKTPAFVLSVSFQLPAQPIRVRCPSWGFWK